ncbi:hypothetical protein [Klebsiella pneumoniae]|uniref:hypothetical protein n=1 Tax=Klebsiella pneumoniae TaxID=573 RepID=UPI00398689EE
MEYLLGILAGMMCETLTMILVVVWAPSLSLGSCRYCFENWWVIPMILGSVCIGFIVLLVQSVEGEKADHRPARRGRRNWRSSGISPTSSRKTLPLFRHVNSDSDGRYWRR